MLVGFTSAALSRVGHDTSVRGWPARGARLESGGRTEQRNEIEVSRGNGRYQLQK